MSQKPKILVTEPEYFTAESLKVMRRVGKVTARRTSYRELLRVIPYVDALVVRIETRLDKNLLKRARRLKHVLTATTGIDHIDTSYLKQRGISLFSLRGTHSISTAEHALALLFAAARNIPKAHARMIKGHWKRWEHIGTELTGKTLGVLGIGRIGTEVAKRAWALGMNVIAFDPYVSEREVRRRGARKASWSEFLRRSDYFSLHVPLTRETEEMLGAKEFSKTKRHAILVNTARGAVVNEKALLDAFKKNRIQAAALDVYDEEPLSPRSPLRQYARTHKNLILTPHLGASTEEAIRQASMECARALKNYFRK